MSGGAPEGAGGGGRVVLLVRHSVPEIVSDAPARTWRLSAEGHRRCAGLAARLAPYAPVAIVSSVEPKAAETAALVAAHLGLHATTQRGLHEHERERVGWLGHDAFQAAVAAFFARPDDLMLGNETATQARARFGAAVERALAAHPAGNLTIVAHGTVIALFVAHAAGIEPLPFWRRLGIPAFVALEWPTGTLRETVYEVAK